MSDRELPLVEDFRDLLVSFADAGVEFVLVGGWALALHGYARGTDDMDAFGAPVAAHAVTADLFEQKGYGYRMGIKPNLIEVLTSIDGVEYEDAAADAQTFELDGRQVLYMGRRSLMRNKRAAGRPKDLADLAWLESHPADDE